MYYIYHIKGVKIGVSINPQKRVAKQGYTEYEILEEHTCIDRVSVREIELQIQYAYPIDTIPYYKSALEWGTYHGRSKGGKSSGKNKLDNGVWEIIRTKGTKLGNKISCEKQKIKCYAYDKKTHQFIGEFDSISLAANILNLHRRNVAAVLKGKLKTTGNYYFLNYPRM